MSESEEGEWNLNLNVASLLSHNVVRYAWLDKEFGADTNNAIK